MAKKKSTSDSPQSNLSSNVPIVAIGASAGGQQAVVELLQNLLPTTGLAYVYVQHLDPTQESRLVDILGRATEMPVHEAQHLMRVEPNQVYIIPPDQDLEVLDGVLTLKPRESRSSIHMPIDQFFLSLAERQKEGSIAVVLSGAASDGTLGMRAIKAAGGITFAQDETARFQSMPRSAILEGVVDRVLPPAEIAKELERLSQQTSLFQQTTLTELEETDNLEAMLDEPTASSSEDLRMIIQLLRRSTGVDFSHYKITTIRRRIIRRTLLYKLDSLRAYADYLRQHPDEALLLYDDLLINVTTFFRDADTMDYIQKVLLPQLVREKPAAEPIRIWVPACSTGQEAYSLAILLLEVLGERAISRTIQLFATDLSESAVAKARLGSYTRGEVMDISPRRLQRFFTKVDDHYRINKSVRDLCVFAPHNLLKDPPFSRLDLVSCRNLLIYLDATLQRKAIVTFHYALNPNGYLVLGKSETVGSSAQMFSQLEKNYKIFARKNDVDSRATFTLTPRQLDGDYINSRPTTIPKTTNQPSGNLLDRHLPSGQERWSGSGADLDKLVDNLLLNQYVPASVVVSQDMEILQFRGSTGMFLEPSPGKASLNLIKMARPALVFELRNAVHKAQKSGESVRKSGLEFKVRNKTHYASIEAVPLDTATEERLFLIIFEEVDPPVAPVTQSTSARNRRIKELESELANLREDMRSIIEEQEASNEELQSANEEIISSNEELQSINEELETSKEEIESTNEELLTINQELQVRNDQLSEAHQFSEDIFNTIREATLVLDTDLRIKSANPAFYRLFQLNASETEGRLIYELGNRQWDIPDLRLMLTDVVTSGAQFQGYELTYQSLITGEKRLSLNARRVVRQQDSILLAIEDITEHRRAQQLLAEREAWFHQIADNAPTLIWVTDANGQYTFLNKVWLEFTGRSQEEVMKRGWAESLHPDDQSDYLKIYNSNLNTRQSFQTEYRLHRHDGAYRWMQENAQPMFGTDGVFNGFIGSSADVHLQKELNQELDLRVQERTQELEQSNATIQRMLDGSIAAIVLLDPLYNKTGSIIDFVFRAANKPSEEIYQKTEAQLLGKRLLEELPDTHRAFLDTYLSVMETGESVRMEGLYSQAPLEAWLDMTVTKNGGGLILSFINITERRKAESEIRKNLTLLQQTENIAKTGSWEYNRSTGTMIWSEGMYRLFGLELGTLVKPETYLTFAHEDDRATAQRLVENLEQGTQSFEETIRIRSTDGVKTLKVIGEIMQDRNPAPLRVLGIDWDITDLEQAAEQLREQAINLQAVLNSSPAAISFLKPVYERSGEFGTEHIVDFRLVVCNQEFAQIAGYAVADLSNQVISQLADKLWKEHSIDNIRHVLETGEPFFEDRYDADKDQWMLIALTKFDSGVVLTGQDFTRSKKAEQQQEQWLNELEKSNENMQVLVQLRQQLRERGEFLRSTSHDLRGNFGIIQGAATLLDMANTDEERSQILSMLQRNLKQGTQMLTELLDMARLEAGQEKRQVSSFNVADLLNGLIDSVQPLASERQLWLHNEGAENLTVQGDAVKVHRIAQNLLLNALNYTQTGGVTVQWGDAPTSDRWLLTITDTGPGLPERTRIKSGEGIGLVIVQQLCQLLDCQIEINSQPETGTQFRLLFPRTYPD
ncbi:PAS domain S-box protein [Spirosoma sp. RP8]|uniref:PAS domain S-box protein n=1 Tax=Spirosoma liriopis TaxID=2937440 RepID=A0ABT0HW48_9BACT|nr:chemotaxis protein CheB [Spirosoma liriopis]MCK8495740.1 PAS domain S-box protein [Spirosoma liriopis]